MNSFSLIGRETVPSSKRMDSFTTCTQTAQLRKSMWSCTSVMKFTDANTALRSVLLA